MERFYTWNELTEAEQREVTFRGWPRSDHEYSVRYAGKPNDGTVSGFALDRYVKEGQQWRSIL